MSVRSKAWLATALLGALLLWAYWPTLGKMAERWSTDPQYSHGYLVPLFSLFLLWSRRDLLQGRDLAPSSWGLAFLLAGLALRALGTVVFLEWFDEVSIILCLLGLAVVAGGWTVLRWSAPAILFLVFMAPLPYSAQHALGSKLQRVATLVSTFALQTLGAPAIAEGNLILINDVRIGIVEACSGLGMLVTFFALSTAMALLMRKSDWWLRLVLVLSAAPVAILANVARITVTGLLYNAARHDLARVVFHDVAGWLMMPLAVAILLWEIRVLNKLIVDRKPAGSEPASVPWLPGVNPSAAGS